MPRKRMCCCHVRLGVRLVKGRHKVRVDESRRHVCPDGLQDDTRPHRRQCVDISHERADARGHCRLGRHLHLEFVVGCDVEGLDRHPHLDGRVLTRVGDGQAILVVAIK